MITIPSSPPGLVFRAAARRFHTQLDWLDSWHSFSFASHVDRAWMGYGPLRVINDDTIAPGQGFGMHPHRDMEIITVMVEGQLHHHDSMGHHAVLHAGEVQCMSAGTGIVHSERNGGEEPCRLLQIWIEPNRVGLAPSYGQKPFPLDHGWTLLLDPEGTDGAMAIHRSVRLWRGRARPGELLTVALEGAQLGWIQMVSGSGQLNLADGSGSMSLERGDGLGVACPPTAAPIESLRASADGVDLLLFAFS